MPNSISPKQLAVAAPPSATERTNPFLALPLEIRNQIYNHLFTISYPIYIFQDHPSSRIESFAPDTIIQSVRNNHYQWSALLYVNRQISSEARAVLYSVNEFQLMEVDDADNSSTKQALRQTTSLLESFLEGIGAVNAGLLSCLCMRFPGIEEEWIEEDNNSGSSGGGGCQSPGKMRIRQDDLQKLQLLRKGCTGLKVLDLIHTGLTMTTTARAGDLQEVFHELNAQFRGIPCLTRIIIRVIDIDTVLHSSIRTIMQNLGWVVVLGDR